MSTSSCRHGSSTLITSRLINPFLAGRSACATSFCFCSCCRCAYSTLRRTSLLTHPHRPDAIFCYNDRLASGVIRAATDAGLRVPQDLAVIGIGDSEEGQYSRPTLSTVAIDPAYIAHHALDQLIRRLKGATGTVSQIVAPHVVLPRESTAPAA